MSHQDWTPVVFAKPKAQPKKTSPTYTEAKIRIDEDGQEYKKIYKLSPEEIKEYTKYRVDLKLTRADIAKKICSQQSDIDCLELGKPSNSHIGGKYKSFLKREIGKLAVVKEV